MFFDVPSITTFVLLLLLQNNLTIMKMLEFVLVDPPILLPIKMNHEWSIHMCCYLERTMTMYGGFNGFEGIFFVFVFIMAIIIHHGQISFKWNLYSFTFFSKDFF